MSCLSCGDICDKENHPLTDNNFAGVVMTDTFTKDRFTYLETLSADPRISPIEFEVGFVIAKHVNRKSREAWPGLMLIAKGIGGNEKTVRRAIAKLVSLGYLTRRRAGRGNSNRYTVILKKQTDDRTPVSSHVQKNPQYDRTRVSTHPQHDRTYTTDHSTPFDRTHDRTLEAPMSGHPCPPNPLMNPLKAEREGSWVLQTPERDPSLSAELSEVILPTVSTGVASTEGKAPSGGLRPHAFPPAPPTPIACAERKEGSSTRENKKKKTPHQEYKSEFNYLWKSHFYPSIDKATARADYIMERSTGTTFETIRDRLDNDVPF